MSISAKALAFITDAIKKGLTVYITCYGKSVAVSPKNFASWEKSENKLFKMDADGNLRMASGKKYNIIATPNSCLVKIEAQ